MTNPHLSGRKIWMSWGGGSWNLRLQQLLWRMARTVCAPLTVPWYRCGVDDDQLLMDLKKMGPEIVRYPELRSPPDLVYHIVPWAKYAMLRRLEHEFDYSDLFRAHVNYVVDVAEGRKNDGEPVGGPQTPLKRLSDSVGTFLIPLKWDASDDEVGP